MCTLHVVRPMSADSVLWVERSICGSCCAVLFHFVSSEYSGQLSCRAVWIRRVIVFLVVVRKYPTGTRIFCGEAGIKLRLACVSVIVAVLSAFFADLVVS